MSVPRQLRRRLRADQIQSRFEPCLPRCRAAAGRTRWLHQIKHDGFRILAHRQGRAIRLVTCNGHDLADRFQRADAAVASGDRTISRQSGSITNDETAQVNPVTAATTKIVTAQLPGT